MLGEEHPLALQLDDLLRRMDTHSIERAIARPMGAELVVGNQAGNNRVLKCGHEFADSSASILGMVPSISMNSNVANKAAEVGLFLHPSRQGFMPTEPVVAPVLDFAAEAEWPVMFHTGSYIYSDVLAVAEITQAYPQTPFILGCGGFADMWFEIPGAMVDVPDLWLDTSHTLGDGILRNNQNGRPTANHLWERRAEQLLCFGAKCLENLDFDTDTKTAILPRRP